jgi:hypothetical protein
MVDEEIVLERIPQVYAFMWFSEDHEFLNLDKSDLKGLPEI